MQHSLIFSIDQTVTVFFIEIDVRPNQLFMRSATTCGMAKIFCPTKKCTYPYNGFEPDTNL